MDMVDGSCLAGQPPLGRICVESNVGFEWSKVLRLRCGTCHRMARVSPTFFFHFFFHT